MTETTSKKAGFSLIELLFAMLFMTIIVFGVIKLQTSNLTLSNTRQMELRAYSYVTEGLEILSVLGQTEVTTGCGGENEKCYLKRTGNNYDVVDDEKEWLEVDQFERIVRYSTGGADLTNAIIVTVEVEWEDNAGDHRVSGTRVLF